MLRCPRQHRFRYVEKLPRIANGDMVQGRCAHGAIEHNYRQKVEAGVDLALDEVTGFFAEQFDVAVRNEEIDWRDASPEVLRSQGIDIVTLYQTEIASRVTPLMVEKPFAVDLGDSFPFVLTGRFDLVDSAGAIVDNKFLARTPSEAAVHADLQLSVYALAYRLLFREQEAGLRIEGVVKNKTLKAVSIATERTDDQCRWVLGLIEEVGRAIQAGVAYPDPTGWWCSRHHCEFWGECMGDTERKPWQTS